MKKERILVVDDEADILMNLRAALTREGYEVHSAGNGKEALDKMAAIAPDTVLLDVMMPGMDGYEVCRKIKGDPATEKATVIFLTAKDVVSSKVKGLDGGADDYLTKPFSYDELCARLRVFSRIRDYRDKLVGMVEFGKAIGILRLDTLLAELKERIPRVFGAGLFSLFALDEKRSLRFLASNHVEFPEKEMEEMPLSESAFMSDVVDKKEILVVRDFSTSPYAGDTRREKYADDYAIGIPLIRGEEVLGVLNLNSPGEAFLENPDITYMKLGAEQLASAISNAMQYRKIQEMAVTDGMTGLYNYRFFHGTFTAEWERARRYGELISVILLDIDHFKKINDTYGHLNGDIVLRRTGKLLKSMVRAVDTVARYGGEEFVVMLPHTRKEEAAVLAERVRKEFEALSIQGEKEIIRITVSMGVADSSHPNLEKCEDLIGVADERLYAAKRCGRNRVVFE